MNIGSPAFVTAMIRSIEERVMGRLANSAFVERQMGVVKSFDSATQTAEVYLNGSAVASGGFKVRGSDQPVANDVVSVCRIGHDRWIESVLRGVTPPKVTTYPTQGYVDFSQISSPSNPSASTHRVFVKSDGYLYLRNSSGTEQKIGETPAMTVTVKDAGSTVGTRGAINLVDSTSIVFTGTDDSVNDEVEISASLTGTGTADQWNAYFGNNAWATVFKVWGPTDDVSATSSSTWVDTGFSFTYTTSDTSLAFDAFIIHNRQAAGGGLQFRWYNVNGNTGGNVRGLLELAANADSFTAGGSTTNTILYDTAYGGVVPDTLNTARYGRWKGRLLLPTSAGGTIKLQVKSVANAEARYVRGSWIQYAKF